MIAAALLVPVGLLATQITISEVSAEREGGRVAITIRGDAMIDPEAASAKVGEGRLYLFVQDARVREANRAWDNDVAEGAEEIRAHRHRQKVELAIPLGDVACQGPVEFEKAPGGLRALVACEGGPRPSAARVKEAAAPRTAPRLEPAVKTGALPALSASEMTALKAKLALDPAPGHQAEQVLAATIAIVPKTKDVPLVVSAAAVDPKPVLPVAPVANAVSQVGAGKPRLVPPAPSPSPAPAPVPAATPPTLSPAPTAAGNGTVSTSSAGGGSVVLAGFAFLAVAGAAFFFSRRRRATGRHIEILETASLGPKRALVVARVGGARMILGSSEAGITLLQALSEPAERKEVESLAAQIVESMPTAEDAAWDAMVTATLTPPTGIPAVPALPPAAAVVAAPPPELPPAPAPAVVVVSSPTRAGMGIPGLMSFEPTMRIEVEEAPSPSAAISLDSGEPRPVGQAGLLARLFRKGTPANDALMPRFEDILEDSFEDQELRRKLALGLPGRIR